MNMANIFTADSFGADLPANWEEICGVLNNYADAHPDMEANDIWESYWNGDIITVNFATMPTVDGTGEQNAMWCMVKVDGVDTELYAYEIIPEGTANDDAYLGDCYLRLMDEITDQAEEVGVDPDKLAWPCG
jgi:hypothetical protein